MSIYLSFLCPQREDISPSDRSELLDQWHFIPGLSICGCSIGEVSCEYIDGGHVEMNVFVSRFLLVQIGYPT